MPKIQEGSKKGNELDVTNDCNVLLNSKSQSQVSENDAFKDTINTAF